jgi:hypothetical protein
MWITLSRTTVTENVRTSKHQTHGKSNKKVSVSTEHSGAHKWYLLWRTRSDLGDMQLTLQSVLPWSLQIVMEKRP